MRLETSFGVLGSNTYIKMSVTRLHSSAWHFAENVRRSLVDRGAGSPASWFPPRCATYTTAVRY